MYYNRKINKKMKLFRKYGVVLTCNYCKKNIYCNSNNYSIQWKSNFLFFIKIINTYHVLCDELNIEKERIEYVI